MFSNQRGIATIVGLIVIAVMLGGMAVVIQAVREPQILQSEAAQRILPINIFTTEEAGPSADLRPSARPATGEGCDPTKLICFDKAEAVVTIEQGKIAQGDYWVSPAFQLIGKGRKGFLLQVENLPAGVGLDIERGIFENDGSFNVNARVLKEGSAVGEYQAVVTLLTGNEETGFVASPEKLNLKIIYLGQNQ